MIDNLIQYLSSKKIAIVGFGMEGQSTYKFIRKYLQNIDLTIKDQATDLYDKYNYLTTDEHLKVICGNKYLDDLDNYDLIIKTPGISFKNLDISSFSDKITSELELLLEFIDVYTIGITGTKGKSTTSSLIYKIISEQNKKVLLLGNIGKPIFDYLEYISNDMILVLEMSSHQLQFVRKSPNIGVLLNLFPEHLDHYNSLDEYIMSKFNIFKFQNKNNYSLYTPDNKLVLETTNNFTFNSNVMTISATKDSTIYLKDGIIYSKNKVLYDSSNSRLLLGDHNLYNIMFALGVCNILGLNLNKAVKSINTFEPLPHRMEYVGVFDDIHYYNDSIATIPEAVMHCVNTLKMVDTLIIGGMDRGNNFNEFIHYLSTGTVRNIVCMPTTGTTIGNRLKEILDNKTDIHIYQVSNLEEAVSIAKDITIKGQICLLSPAAASYGYFKNFEERGNEFKRLVKKRQ